MQGVSIQKEKNAALSAQPESKRLWMLLEKKSSESLLRDARVLLVGFDLPTVMELREQIQSLDVNLVASGPEVGQLHAVGQGGAFNSVIVNLDSFEDADTAVETLLSFRSHSPKLAVVLVSAHVSADDFGPERRLLCDATLRRPLTESRLEAALLSGIRNKVAPDVATG